MSRASLVFPVAILLALAFSSESRASACSPAKPSTFSYKTVSGVDRNLTSLDLYMPSKSCRKGKQPPVVVWVHGGGYQTGDKSNGAMLVKAALFNSQGWALVSINYRLTDISKPNPWRWPTHYEDAAAAIAWVKKNIASKGGDAAKIALLGHSAGADIVSNLATQPTYLAKYRMSPKDLRCQGPLDTEGFDKGSSSDSDKPMWTNALGNAPDYQRTTSATLIARRGVGTPKAVVALRGTKSRIAIGNAYVAKLAEIGVSGNVAINAGPLTHAEVNTRIGQQGDSVMTPPLISFLKTCLR